MTKDLCSFEILTSVSDSADGFMSGCLDQPVTKKDISIQFLDF